MTDLERFFRRLVEQLAATDPARLHRPLPLDEVMHRLVPYRANRKALGVDTSEEYELVVMRLCAGEGALVRTDPEEARTRFAEELASANPDLEALHSFESVLITLRPESLSRALGPTEAVLDLAPEPREAEPDGHELPSLPQIHGLEALPEVDEELEADADPDPETVPEAEPPSRCAFCGGRLPTARAVNFCPHCGQSQILTLCPECRSEVEPGWKHCVNCGRAVAEA